MIAAKPSKRTKQHLRPIEKDAVKAAIACRIYILFEGEADQRSAVLYDRFTGRELLEWHYGKISIVEAVEKARSIRDD